MSLPLKNIFFQGNYSLCYLLSFSRVTQTSLLFRAITGHIFCKNDPLLAFFLSIWATHLTFKNQWIHCRDTNTTPPLARYGHVLGTSHVQTLNYTTTNEVVIITSLFQIR